MRIKFAVGTGRAFVTLLLGATLTCLPSLAFGQSSDVKLWRLDCGTIDVDQSEFSDVGLYKGQRKRLASSCYLLRNGSQLLLWDTGLDGALAGSPRDKDGSELKERLGPQLDRIGVKSSDITYVGISHYHYDHTGQVSDFPNATLLIGKADWEVVRVWKSAEVRFRNWLSGNGKLDLVEGDRDVFGDGVATIIGLPGHTEGHQALLVKLASGYILLSGDEYHFTENRTVGGVPAFNVNRADTLASHDRFEQLAKNLRAKVIIQHEPNDVSKIPAFPQAAQ